LGRTLIGKNIVSESLTSSQTCPSRCDVTANDTVVIDASSKNDGIPSAALIAILAVGVLLIYFYSEGVYSTGIIAVSQVDCRRISKPVSDDRMALIIPR
jgi:hypothetical protein